jgi:two-component system, NarL family, nitrate/nitrite response regulator NarL
VPRGPRIYRGGMASAVAPSRAAHEPPIRVLLVDDSDYVLWGLRKLIESVWPRMAVAGVARSMAEAFEMVQRCGTDVVVLDLMLGLEIPVDQLAALRRAAAAPVLVLTASADFELLGRAVRQGACGVVMKDAPAEALLREIERAHALPVCRPEGNDAPD